MTQSITTVEGYTVESGLDNGIWLRKDGKYAFINGTTLQEAFQCNEL